MSDESKCACRRENGCHCPDYDPAEHCDCSLCAPTVERIRSIALALSAQAGENAHNKERVHWGLQPIVVTP